MKPLPPNWDEIFPAIVAAEMQKPFDWAGAHCWDFCAAVIDAKRGPGAAPQFPSVRDARSAARLYRRDGDGTLASVMALHFDETGVLSAQRGDIGVVEGNGIQCAVVCIGATWLGRDVNGLVEVQHRDVKRAFST